MARWHEFGYYPPSRPREAKGGIKAQSTRGAFASSWWGQRWIATLESFPIGARLGRGRSYACKGQVTSLEIDKEEWENYFGNFEDNSFGIDTMGDRRLTRSSFWIAFTPASTAVEPRQIQGGARASCVGTLYIRCKEPNTRLWSIWGIKVLARTFRAIWLNGTTRGGVIGWRNPYSPVTCSSTLTLGEIVGEPCTPLWESGPWLAPGIDL